MHTHTHTHKEVRGRKTGKKADEEERRAGEGWEGTWRKGGGEGWERGERVGEGGRGGRTACDMFLAKPRGGHGDTLLGPEETSSMTRDGISYQMAHVR